MEFVYVMRQKGTVRYKIGRAVDLVKRRKQLQTGNPDEIELVCAVDVGKAASRVEAMLQGAFRQCAVKGEWFSLSKEASKHLLWLIDLVAATKRVKVVKKEKELDDDYCDPFSEINRHNRAQERRRQMKPVPARQVDYAEREQRLADDRQQQAARPEFRLRRNDKGKFELVKVE